MEKKRTIGKTEKGTPSQLSHYVPFPGNFQGPVLPLILILLFFTAGCTDSNPGDSPRESVNVSKIPYLSDDDFLSRTRTGIVLLDFTASWCGPCKMMEPHLEKVYDKLGDKIMIARIDVDRSREASGYFGITAMPTLIVLVDGKVKRAALGYQEEQQILDLVEDLIKERENAEPATMK